MEVDDLYGFVLMLIMVGLLLGVGVLILDKTGSAIYSTETVTNLSFTMPAVDTNLSLGMGNITSFGIITNGTADVFEPLNYTVYKLEGYLLFDDVTLNRTCVEGQTCYVTTLAYTEYENEATKAFGFSIAAIAPIASTWLTLIVTIVILAMILVLVIRAFANKGR